MLLGRFDNTSGRPFLDAYLIVPRLSVEGPVSFLVDTGADSTVLMQVDAARLKIDYRTLHRATESVGIGGISRDFVEPAQLIFSEPNVGLHVYETDLVILRPKRELAGTPSLLGRNITNSWRLTVDPSTAELSAEVRRSDRLIRLR